jgi:hypothetical protein
MSTAKRSGTYNPAEHGLAKYFLSMLDDKDRNVKYGEAIKKCIEEFETKEQRKPRVLDIGIGTGMLSSLCLLHGAAHVTGVDVNSTMVGLARASLKALDPTGKQHKVLLVRPGPSALPPEERFDMVVSEILGTLTTSESMFKYVSIYRHHLNTFGADHKVYAVPQQTTQYAALHRFSRQDLGEPLSAALEVALHLNRDAFGRFMPSNEGGLALPLYLWKSELVGGKRHAIHTESYEALPPRAEGQGADGGGGGSFVANGLERPVVYEAETLNTACDEDAFVLCVLEWSVQLWGDVNLENTLEAYRGMPLRNALARASAWGFFIADVPSLRSGVPRRAPLTVRANRMNAAAGQGTPELVIDGHRVANVCEEPAPYVAMAADADAADRLFEALKALRCAGASQRVLIVNDTTAGKLPFEAAVHGFDVDVVNDDQLATEAGKRAVEKMEKMWQAGRAHGPTALAAAAAPSSEAKPAAAAPVRSSPRRRGKGTPSSEAEPAAAAPVRSSPRRRGKGTPSSEAKPAAAAPVRSSPRRRGPSSEAEPVAAPPVRFSPRRGNGKRTLDETALPGSHSKRARESKPTDQIHWHVGRVATGGAEARKTRGAFMPSTGSEAVYDAVVLGAALLDEMRDDKHRLEHSKAIVDRWSKKTGKVIPEPAKLVEKVHEFDRADFYTDSLPEAFKGTDSFPEAFKEHRCLAGVEGALRALGEPCAQADGGAPFATNDDGLVFHGVHTVLPYLVTVEGGKRSRATAAASLVSTSSADRSDEPADEPMIRAGVHECSAKLPDGKEPLAATLEAFAKLLNTSRANPEGLKRVLEKTVAKLTRAEELGARSAVARATYLGVKLRLKREAPKRPKAPKTAAA